MPVEYFTLGMEVGIDKIDRELKALWQEGDGGMTRASLMNLAVYCGEGSMQSNTTLISKLTEDHACRAILIASDVTGKMTAVRAWISAHCHVSRAGAKQVCSEQISFLLPSNWNAMIPNIVFSHLDSDLPLYLWWQGEFPSDEEMPLLAWVDRLIFDSYEWTDCASGLRALPGRIGSFAKRLTFRDVNWSRSLAMRRAVARIFDHPDSLPSLRKISRVTIDYGAGFRSTAALVAGWLASRLGWTIAGGKATAEDGAEIEIVLNEADGGALSGCRLEAGAATFAVNREGESEYLKVAVVNEDGRPYDSLVPAGCNETFTLINEELGRGKGHENYMASLNAALPLL